MFLSTKRSLFFIYDSQVDVCILLLQHGADPSIRNSEGKTPLDMADALTKPVLTGEYKKDELLEASRSGIEGKLMALLTPLNVNCHASDGRKSTPLHLAAGYNRTRIVQLLLQHGADVHAKDKGGLVPLHNACSYGHFEVTELLIRHGANVNAMDLWQYTPLHEAASKGRSEVSFRSLLSLEAVQVVKLAIVEQQTIVALNKTVAVEEKPDPFRSPGVNAVMGDSESSHVAVGNAKVVATLKLRAAENVNLATLKVVAVSGQAIDL